MDRSQWVHRDGEPHQKNKERQITLNRWPLFFDGFKHGGRVGEPASVWAALSSSSKLAHLDEDVTAISSKMHGIPVQEVSNCRGIAFFLILLGQGTRSTVAFA